MPHNSTTWKVLGEIAAPTGSGVLGHNTATTGTAHGVEGVSDSAAEGAAGVFGRAAAGSVAATYGVYGVTDADADPGNEIFPSGVRGEATGSGGVVGVTGFNADDPDGLGVAGVGTVGTGVFGRTYESNDGVQAVEGWASATSGRTYGVEGRTDSVTDGAAGVRGIGTATSGGIYGVLGQTDSSSGVGSVGAVSDSAPLISLEGHPTGVWGHTDKSGADANVNAGYGVFGASTATTGLTYGVVGRTYSSDGYGVFSVGTSKTDGSHEVTGGTVHKQRGDPSTSELPDGSVMTYNSDGSGTGSAGDLIYAVNDGGTVKTTILAERSNAT